MRNEFTYELIEPEEGLTELLSEPEYLKLSPNLRAKYLVKDESDDKEKEEIDEVIKDEDLYTEVEDLEEIKASRGKLSRHYEEEEDFGEFGTERNGRVIRRNEDDY